MYCIYEIVFRYILLKQIAFPALSRAALELGGKWRVWTSGENTSVKPDFTVQLNQSPVQLNKILLFS